MNFRDTDLLGNLNNEQAYSRFLTKYYPKRIHPYPEDRLILRKGLGPTFSNSILIFHSNIVLFT
ncbi:hypothetical protein AMTRI_Chr10g229730 [Amborella trichopoda]